MEMTAAAQWLNSAFSGFDGAILRAMHAVAGGVGVVLTPLMKLITLLGEKGLLMFLLAFAFMLFARHRRSGICIFGAVCCGALITSIFLKDAIGRPRPFETLDLYRDWWNAVGSPAEDGFSFPSGHVTALTAGMTALWLTKGKKFIIPAAVSVLLMCLSRNYLMAHYPSDVLFAGVVGVASAFAAYGITCLIYRFLERFEDNPLFAFVLDEDVPLPDLSSLGSLASLLSPSALKKAGYKGKHEK